MPYNGSGTYNRVYDWTTDAGNGLAISSSRMDTEMDGMATGLSTCITKDGQTTITANLPMSGFNHTGVGDADARDEYGVVGQIQDQEYTWCNTAGGTANAQTLTPAPAITAYEAGQAFEFLPVATNTSGTVTIATSGLSTRSVKKSIGGALVALSVGDLVINVPARVIDDGTQYVLMNPAPMGHGADVASVAGTVVLDTVTGGLIDITGTEAITAFTLAEGRIVRVRAAGAFTLTHGASLVCPGSANIVCAAGDQFDVAGYASGVVRIFNYQRLNGSSVLSALLNVQTITTTGAGTYTPTAGMKKCIIELQAAGGGSGGTTGTGGETAASGAGGGGGYLKILATAANIGASAAISVGAAGTAGSSGNNNGGAGGDTTITINSSTWTAGGGGGGTGQASSASAQIGAAGGAGGTNTTGSNATTLANIPGQAGGRGQANGATTTSNVWSGKGGDAQLGRGAAGGAGASAAGHNYGGGASGYYNGTAGNVAGSAGAQGVIIIYEYQ